MRFLTWRFVALLNFGGACVLYFHCIPSSPEVGAKLLFLASIAASLLGRGEGAGVSK